MEIISPIRLLLAVVRIDRIHCKLPTRGLQSLGSCKDFKKRILTIVVDVDDHTQESAIQSDSKFMGTDAPRSSLILSWERQPFLVITTALSLLT
jgi:hypothetical protein